MKTSFNYLLLLVCLFSTLSLQAQPGRSSNADFIHIAEEYISTHLPDWNLMPGDIAGMTIRDMYTDKNSGITRIYFLQHYHHIPIYNAILNLSIDQAGNVFHAGNRFVQDVANKINTTEPVLNAGNAVSNLAHHLGLSYPELRIKEIKNKTHFIFEKGNIAEQPIEVELIYQPQDDKLLLSWQVRISPKNKPDRWCSRVDAIHGDVLEEDNWTIYCAPADLTYPDKDNACPLPYEQTFLDSTTQHAVPQYNVWPAPIESPNHGPRTLVSAPSDTLASPFGWHDTNGIPGAEYQITRGNNTHAFQDQANLKHSSNDEPNGGPDLLFDFPFDPSFEPAGNVDAAVVNLFYWTNYMHDFAYHFGFDEAAGNFQQNNYGRGGEGSDPLIALTQQGSATGKVNNAYYQHDLEGSSPNIGMYIFHGTKRFLFVNEPVVEAGSFKTSFPSAGWGAGAYVDDTPVSGEVVIARDGIDNPYATDACETIINGAELNGKIALIDRGGCEFGWKALQAQQAGAIAVIFCNIDDDDYTMNPGTYGSSVHIPVLMIGISDCQSISSYAGNGLHVTLKDPGQVGPMALDSDFENGLIAHEFSHGISKRLVGGPGTACLFNAEQMGEGWSDFISLAVTARPGDSGEMKRGFGTYAVKDEQTGRGFRRYAYSTDMGVMPLTYGDVAPNQEVHNLGEVWAAMLWDMYWALVEKYGWSADPYDETSGNHRAIQLVFDGLKNTPCSPGFVDGRNAILAADESLYNGDDLCLLWEVFARRGLGYSADQGSTDDAGDQKEAFDLPPTCINQMMIEKSVTQFIQPGDDIQVHIKTGNYKDSTVTNVLVTDEIPQGTSFKLNSANFPATVQGNIVTFHLGDLNTQEEITIDYALETSHTNWSHRKFLDEVPDANNINWLTYTIGSEAPNDWKITDESPGHAGRYIWSSEEIAQNGRQVLELNPDAFSFHVSGEHPALCFYHRYNTVGGTNGGLVEIKEVTEDSWHQVSDAMLRNGYIGKISYLTFIDPKLHAFYGNSGDDLEATYVDLREWMGKDIHVRFRFGTRIETRNGLGWLIDDIEFMDLLAYNGEACVMSDQGDVECVTAPEAGTIVASRALPVSVTEETATLMASIYPNPASDNITLTLASDHPQHGCIALRSIEGKQFLTMPFALDEKAYITINTKDLPSGLYIVQVMTPEGQHSAKVVIQK